MHGRRPNRRIASRFPLARSLGAVCVLAVGLVLPFGAAAQDRAPTATEAVTGTVAEADGRPVLGALVAVEDEEDRRLRSVLTDDAGRFHLPLPGPGTYRLRVERLGYRAVVTDPFTVAEGEVVRRDLEVAGDPIRLAQVDVIVEAEVQCVIDPESGALLAELWEQARQAFRRVEVTDQEAAGYRFHLRRYERAVELPTARVVQEEWRSPSTSLRSFQSPPAEELLDRGWEQTDDDGTLVYFGPDLQVLLSDAFQRAHCLRLRSDPQRPDQVGIAFEPVGTESLPAIRGTLWLDRETVELEELTFHYTRHLYDQEIPDPLLELFGGEIEFRALPDGRWVVDQWVLRVPRFQSSGRPAQWRTPTDPELRERLEGIRRVVERAPRTWQEMVTGGRLLFWEEGGLLARVETAGGAVLPSRDEAALEGVVWDSLQGPGADAARAPLEDAVVRLAGTDVRATTDADGRFRVGVPLEGRYEVTFEHPVMDSLGIPSPEPVPVTLRPGLVEEVELALPSRATLLARACEGSPAAEGTGIVVGTVLDEALREPVPGAQVMIRPEAVEEGGPPADTLTTRASADGTFHFCDVPAGTWYEITAGIAGLEGPPRRLMVPAPGRTVERDAWADQGQRGVVAGRVREGQGGPPVAEAFIVLEGPERRTVYADGRGRFELLDVAPGTYRVRAEHVAFRTSEGELEVPRGGARVTAEIRLLPNAIALEPVVASVEARSPRLQRAGFYERQQAGFGSFITRDEIERRNPVGLIPLFNRIPRAQAVGERIVFRGSEVFGGLNAPAGNEGPTPCFPELYVDGTWWGKDYSLHFIHPEDVEAIEVYASAAQIPIRYNTSNSACGVILIWLRDGSEVTGGR